MTLDFSTDGTTLAVSGFEAGAALWDVATGPRSARGSKAGERRAMIDLSADGRRLLLTHGDGQGAVYDVDPELGPTCVHGREPHPDARGVGGVPPGATIRAGLRDLSVPRTRS